MTPPDQSAQPAAGPIRRSLRWLLVSAIALFVLQTSAKAVQAAWWNDDFPEALAVKVELMPLVFPLHMVAGGLALILAPMAFVLRGKRRRHRIAGRIAAVDIAVAGLTAFPVALVAPVTLFSSIGFAAQGAVWLLLLALGVVSIRAGKVTAHRACMLMMLAVTSGAVLFRIWLALWAILAPGWHYTAFYAADAWFAWAAPLAMTALFLRREGARESKGIGAGIHGALAR